MNKEWSNNINFSKKIYLDAIKKYAPSRKLWLPPDKALFSPDSIFNVPNLIAKELRFNAIKFAFNYHYNKSYFYHSFCKDLDVKPDDIKNEEDFVKIPLLSDMIFKDHPEAGINFINWLDKLYAGNLPEFLGVKKRMNYDEIINYFQNHGITLVYSSGTSGKFSFVPRDTITWNRQMFMCSRIFEMSPYDYYSSNSRIIWLGPQPDKTHLYIGRLTMMILDLFDKNKVHFGITRELSTKIIQALTQVNQRDFIRKIKSNIINYFAISEQNKNLEKIIDILDKSEKKDEIIGIGGAPFFIEMLFSKIEERNLKFDFGEGMVVTAGGWKLFTGVAISEERFRSRVNKLLGIPEENCRDIYGMVECNALNVSCEGHYKHIPYSVIYPMVLDEESEPVDYGEYGRFAFLDPLANSYPGFIMSGDKVKLLQQCPICDRPGPVICRDVSRLGGIQDRGCGAVLARMLSDEITKEDQKQRKKNES